MFRRLSHAALLFAITSPMLAQDSSGVLLVAQYDIGGRFFEIQNNTAFYFTNDTLFALDINEPQNLEVIGSIRVGEDIDTIAYKEDMAFTVEIFVLDGDFITNVINQIELSSPREMWRDNFGIPHGDIKILGFYQNNILIFLPFSNIISVFSLDRFGGGYAFSNQRLSPHRVIEADGYAYFADRNSGLWIFDLSGNARAEFIVHFDEDGSGGNIVFSENLLYCFYNDHINIFNHPDIRTLEVVNDDFRINDTQYFSIQGDYLFLAQRTRGLWIYNVSDPENPHVVGFYQINIIPTGLAISNQHAFILTQDELLVFDYSEALGIESFPPPIANEYSFINIAPNPFNSSTNISYSLPINSDVAISIYDLSGREVYNRILTNQSPGVHNFEYNATGLGSGLYVVQLNWGGNSSHGKMVVLK